MNRSSMRGILIAATAGLVAAVGLGWAGPAGAAAAGVEQESELLLAGTWVLNEELSDEAPGPRGERRGRGRDGSRGGGPGGFGGRGGARPDPDQIARMRETMRGMLVAAPRLTIEGDRDEVVLAFGDGGVVRLIADGREHTGEADAGAQVKRTTRWRGETLETEATLQARRSLTVHQSYAVQDGADGGRQLVVTSRVEGGFRRGGRENRRVYDEAEP